MNSLLDQSILKLVRAMPVERHAFSATAAYWRAKFHGKRKDTLFQTVFGAAPELRLSRRHLLEQVDTSAEQRCVEILLWGYPRNQHGLITKILPSLESFAALASSDSDWPRYYKDLHATNGLAISTITKLAYFHRLKFDGMPALILDEQIMKRLPLWAETSSLIITRASAPNRYVRYLRLMTELSSKMKCKPDQLELFLFTLGRNLA